jgi:hypothetical protein
MDLKEFSDDLNDPKKSNHIYPDNDENDESHINILDDHESGGQ